jgi:hypothetical protein
MHGGLVESRDRLLGAAEPALRAGGTLSNADRNSALALTLT